MEMKILTYLTQAVRYTTLLHRIGVATPILCKKSTKNMILMPKNRLLQTFFRQKNATHNLG
jgi:hypothetical protein